MKKLAIIMMAIVAVAICGVCHAEIYPDLRFSGIDIIKMLDGTEKWVYEAMGPVKYSSPAICSDGTIYVGSTDGSVYAIKPDGTWKWQFQTGGPIYSSPAIGPDGVVYVGSEDGNLYALMPDNGDMWRQYDAVHAVNSTPAIGPGGAIYISSADGVLHALGPDLEYRWSLGASDPYLLSAVNASIGADGTIYAVTTLGGGQSGLFGAILRSIKPDGSDSKVLQTSGGLGASFAPAIGRDGTIYFEGADGILRALRQDGTVVWKAYPEVPGSSQSYMASECSKYGSTCSFRSPPVIGPDNTIYVAANILGNRLFAIGPDGKTKWSIPATLDNTSPAIAADGSIIFASGGNLHCAEPKNGKIKWTFEVPGADCFVCAEKVYEKPDITSSPAIANDGTIYFGSHLGLHAVRSSAGGLADSPWPMFQQNAKHTGKAPIQYGGIVKWVRLKPVNGMRLE